LGHVKYKFAKLLYDKYKINLHKYPTLSSLAIAIYLSNYKNKINVDIPPYAWKNV